MVSFYLSALTFIVDSREDIVFAGLFWCTMVDQLSNLVRKRFATVYGRTLHQEIFDMLLFHKDTVYPVHGNDLECQKDGPTTTYNDESKADF